MNRLRLPDLLKGIAILFMIQVHIMELFIDLSGHESLAGNISLFAGGPFTAMVFMLVMGYFVAKSKKTVKQTAIRGIRIFVLGFLLNIGLNFHLLLKIAFDGWPYNPLEYIFGVDILYLAGLSIIVLAVLKSFPKIQIYLAGTLFLIVILTSQLVTDALTLPARNYVIPFIAGNYSWSYFPLFPWLAYPLAGYFFFFTQKKVMFFFSRNKIFTRAVFFMLLVSVIYFGKFGFSISVDLPKYYHHGFGFSLWALALLILWSVVLYAITQRKINSRAEQFLAWMGKNITLIYVIQWLIIGNIATAIYQTQPLKMFTVWFAGILLATLIITRLAEKTKFIAQ